MRAAVNTPRRLFIAVLLPVVAAMLASGCASDPPPHQSPHSGASYCSGFDLDVKNVAGEALDGGPAETAEGVGTVLRLEVFQIQGAKHFDPPRKVMSAEFPAVGSGPKLRLQEPRHFRWLDDRSVSEPLGHLCADEMTIRLTQKGGGSDGEVLLDLHFRYAEGDPQVLSMTGEGWSQVTDPGSQMDARGRGLTISYAPLRSTVD